VAKSKLLISILALITTVSSVALIGAVLAGHTDPRAFILPAFLGLGFPFLIIIHLVLTVLYFILSRSRVTLLFIIPLLASINILLNFFGLNFFTSTNKKGGESFGFMTYNAHNFHPVDNDLPVRSEMFRLIENEDPDIICFQDFTYPREKDKIVDSLKKILNTQYFYGGPENQEIFPNNVLAIFSRFPIVGYGNVVLSPKTSGNQCIFVDVKKGNKIFRIYNVHLQSLSFREKDYDRWDKGNARNKASFLSRNITRLHIAFINRRHQVKIMRKEMAACKIPFIVAGDFNDSPASYAVTQMSQGLKNTFREKAHGYEVTYNGDLPNFQIDYILTHPAFNTNSYKVIKRKLSDHFPVKAVLSL
jgi:endonuclease/exonuclease/phosphatase family metal-dependent hydrolase